MDGALLAAVQAVIDARLVEHGLLEAAAEETTAAAGKGKGKGKAKDELDLDAMKAKFTALAEAKGKDKAMEVLTSKPWGKAGVKLSDIDEKHFPKMAAAIDAAMEEDADLFG